MDEQNVQNTSEPVVISGPLITPEPAVQSVPPVPPRPNPLEEELRYVGVPANVTTVPYSRKLVGTDAATLKTSSNLGWQTISTASRSDPFFGVPRNANGSTDPVLNYPVDLAFNGEGVDIVGLDGGDGIALPDHPEWLSTKYGTTRYVQEDWARGGVNFPAITGTLNSGGNAVNSAYGLFTLPLSVASQFLSGGLDADECYGRKITILSGPGAGQSRRISSVYLLEGVFYYGFVDPAWDPITSGTAQSGGANTIQLAASASSVDGFYVNKSVIIDSGMGANQTGFITAYVGATRTATISTNWGTPPDNTSVYTVADCPTSASTYIIEPFATVSNYYGDYITSTHGTGAMGLTAGKTYGFAKEATIRAIGSHGGTRLCGGNNGAYSFSGSTITSTNASIRTRLSFLVAGDTITVAGATTASNNGNYQILSNTDNGVTRTVTVTNKTFVSEAAASGTTITQLRYLWGYSQAVELVRLFHINKVDKTRPTVLMSDLSVVTFFTNIAQVSTAFINGAYVPVDLTTPAGRTFASDNYFLPFRNTSDRFLGLAGKPDGGYNGLAAAFNRAIAAGVIVVLPADNYDFRAVDSDNTAFNDYTCIPGDTVATTGTAQGGATTSITLAAGASNINGAYVGSYVKITSGTGSGQNRVITEYDGSTKVATVATAWGVGATPNATSVYSVVNLVKCFHSRHFYSTIPEAVVAGAVTSLYFDNKEYRASYSVVGPRVDVYAPADSTATATFDVTARVLWNGTATNSTSNVPYPYNAAYLTGLFSGTSASCPVTGGLVGCMAQARPWMDSGAARAAIQDTGTKNRLYIPSPDVFSDQKSLGGGVNNYLWYPFTHLTDA